MSNRAEIWDHLKRQATDVPPLLTLFAGDDQRATRFSFAHDGLFADISKQQITTHIFNDLIRLAVASGLEDKRADLFAGRIVNPTEQRPALHPALRGTGGSAEIRRQVKALHKRVECFAEDIRDKGRIKTIVHIGIGGSALGSQLLYQAFQAVATSEMEVRFVGNVDGHVINQALAGLDPAQTLVILVSKSFSTQETIMNGAAAREWLGAHKENLVAVTANTVAAKDFGVGAARIFEFWDWVGGRFSLWSAVSLSVILAYGPEMFDALLAGAHSMDQHFLDTEFENNLPVVLALIDIWNRNFLGRPARAVIPYAHALRTLPTYLQQLEMESNGKSVRLDGTPAIATAQIVFGYEGTNAQHAFFQQIHQGPDVIPVDFLAVLSDNTGRPEQHQALLANCFAQSEALMCGRAHTDPHRAFPGNRPSTTFVLDQLDTYTLGQLLALFEHKVFAESVIWNINPFDQFGVELGKVMAGKIETELAGGSECTHDASTAALIALAQAKTKP